MASLFDEWVSSTGNEEEDLHESDNNITQQVNRRHVVEEQSTEDPIFTVELMNWIVPLNSRGQKIAGFVPPKLTSFACGNNVLLLGTSDKKLYRWKVNGQFQEIELPSRDCGIYRLFVDPTGKHGVISLRTGDNYYLHESTNKLKELTKIHGMIIESIGWDKQAPTDKSTGTILIGSRNGQIFESVIEEKDKYCKKVCDLRQSIPICGLFYERFPGSLNKYFVMLATANPTRYYQYVGGPDFEHMFDQCKGGDNAFTEFPGDIQYTELQFYSKYIHDVARTFALLTNAGIYYGTLLFASQNTGDTVVHDYQLIQLDSIPESIALTEFYFILAYKNELIIQNQLNNEIVLRRQFTSNEGNLLSLSLDNGNNTVWLCAENGIYKINIKDEDRNVWNLYLTRAKNGNIQDFETAYQHCKDDNERDIVLQAQAAHYFNSKDYDRSAKYYARTQCSFEEVSLKFISVNENDALRTFLLLKLKQFDNNNNNGGDDDDDEKRERNPQKTLICTWLTELFLDKLNSIPEDPKNVNENSNHEEEITQISFDFREFLNEYLDDLDGETTFKLLSSHGRVDLLLYYASLMNDYERILTHHMQRGDYESAIFVLKEADFKSVEDLYYKYSGPLMLNCAEKTIELWQCAPQLNAVMLIPSLVRYEEQRQKTIKNNENAENINEKIGRDFAVDYLEYCINKRGNKDQAIHNYLLSLYCDMDDEIPLLRYLENQINNPVVDLKYALRVCNKAKKLRSCVYIYSMLGLYEEAVKLSLNVDIKLAKMNANKPEDKELQRKLWLEIAKYLIQNNKDIKKGLNVLNECSYIKIEDILPLFPDFTTIDEFKDQICQSLDDYNIQIKSLKDEMEEYTSSADRIRDDIKCLRNRYGYIGANQKCDICHESALLRQFYLFPCTHVFHTDCLMKEVKRYLSPVGRQHLKELKEKLNISVSSNNNEMKNAVAAGLPIKEQVQTEIDELIASECLFCGDKMIDSITEPLISVDETVEGLEWNLDTN